ncbi:hypothetical protein [Glutamicibacter halophytocola]|uniref:Uncharacterized protein n=1 Tax=Glutamicibacter halophytocola TaxID=1933880 RepID=A0AA95BSF9_9MICC|nr:hypothetical protein [Glutamicibacter halophytocola]UUX59427.1 hypothetical protein NUH22_01950 [Glutamicibacter halophytocola]
MAINVQARIKTIAISRMAVERGTGLMIEERINHHPSIGGSGGPAAQAPGGSKGILKAQTIKSGGAAFIIGAGPRQFLICACH